MSVIASKGYEAALATTLKSVGTWVISWDEDVSYLFKAMLVKRPRSKQFWVLCQALAKNQTSSASRGPVIIPSLSGT
jgi:hypothetical protein